MRIHHHGIVDSTSERAFATLAAGTARHGDVHVAEGQSAGRGRLGRRWESPAGEGLYLSMVLLPGPQPHPAAPTSPALQPAALTMGAGLAVLEAVRALGARAARLKWPNDVLVGGAKLAGILVESRGLDPLRPHAVVGIGLNVRQTGFSRELVAERPVVSLVMLGLDVSRERALAVLLERLEPRLDEACRAPESIVREYAGAVELLGRTVRVRRGRDEARGRLVALSLGGLELETDQGRHERVPLEHALEVE